MISTTLRNFILKSPAASHWQTIGIRDHKGFVIYIPALRTKQSCGIGEYLDLLPMIDWAAEVGFDIIQILPINDGGTDPSPYNALSAFALNPTLLSLTPFIHELQAHTLKALKKLNANKRVSYEKVSIYKDKILRDYYLKEQPRLKTNSDYKAFINENRWLEAYSHFRAMKALSNQSWMDWNSTYIHRNAKMNQEIESEAAYYRFLQYLCHQQMKKVKRYAERKGILIKGDIPILVARDSADVWSHPDMFDLTLSAGAPPDQYSVEGQNWGFPLYLWETQYEKTIQWWIERLRYASNYYHIYRLDHVVGLFRIWATPLNESAKEGCFLPTNEALWLPRGEKILKDFLNHCSMLPIAEDLGSVPEAARQCLTKLGIPGTKVIRWERESDGSYISPDSYPPLSMTTVSTHDSEILADWWQKHPQEASPYAHQRHWKYHKKLSMKHEREILSESYHSSSLLHINLLQELLRLNKNLCWTNPEDERINIPGTLDRRNWLYKYRPSVEEITQSEGGRSLIGILKNKILF